MSRAKGSFRVALHALVEALGKDAVSVTHDLVALANHGYWSVDTREYEDAVRRITGNEHADDEAIDRAVSIYRHHLLQGYFLDNCVEFDYWLSYQSSRYQTLQRKLLVEVVKRFVKRHQLHNALMYCKLLLHLDAYAEETHRAIMRLYEWMGDRRLALLQYATIRDSLMDVFGEPPDEKTAELHTEIAGRNRVPACKNRISALLSDLA
jgi:DNA-binding SARP family transcriptional activator